MAHNEQLPSQLTLLTGLHDRDSLTEEPCAVTSRKHGFEAEAGEAILPSTVTCDSFVLN